MPGETCLSHMYWLHASLCPLKDIERLSHTYLPTCLPIFQSVGPSVCSSVYLSVFLSVYVSVCLSASLFVSLFAFSLYDVVSI